MIDALTPFNFIPRLTSHPLLNRDLAHKVAQFAYRIFPIIALVLIALEAYRYFKSRVTPPPLPTRLLLPLQRIGLPAQLYINHREIQPFLREFYRTSHPSLVDSFTACALPDFQRQRTLFLPEEIILEIMQRATAQTVGSCAQTSRRMRHIIYLSSPASWDALLRHRFNDDVDETRYPDIPYKFRAELYSSLCEIFPAPMGTPTDVGNGVMRLLIRRMGPFAFACIPEVTITDLPRHAIERGFLRDGKNFVRFTVKNNQGYVVSQVIGERHRADSYGQHPWLTMYQNGLWPENTILEARHLCQIINLLIGRSWIPGHGTELPPNLDQENVLAPFELTDPPRI